MIEAEAAAQKNWEKAQAAARQGAEGKTGADSTDLAALRTRLSEAQEAVKDAEAKLKALPPLTREQRTLATQRGRRLDDVKAARKEVRDALRARRDAKSRLSAQQRRTRTLDEDRQDTTFQLETAQDQVRTQGIALARRRAALRFIPDTILEDVFADFPYTVRHWTKKCRLRSDMKGARPRQPGANQHLVAWAETKDTSHRGYRRYGVAPNPFKYPKTEAQLVAAAHADLVPLMQAWLERSLDAIRKTRVERARGAVAADKEAALADFIVAWRLNRDAIPEELRTLLTETYGHLEMAWLN